MFGSIHCTNIVCTCKIILKVKLDSYSKQEMEKCMMKMNMYFDTSHVHCCMPQKCYFAFLLKNILIWIIIPIQSEKTTKTQFLKDLSDA